MRLIVLVLPQTLQVFPCRLKKRICFSGICRTNEQPKHSLFIDDVIKIAFHISHILSRPVDHGSRNCDFLKE